MNRTQVVIAARSMIDTPFRHQGRDSKHGVDCGGLVACTAQKVHYPYTDCLPYERLPDGESLFAILETNCDLKRKNALFPGDILVFWLDRHSRFAQHLAIMTHYGMVHAYAPVGKVVEHSYDKKWQRRLLRVYCFRGLN